MSAKSYHDRLQAQITKIVDAKLATHVQDLSFGKTTGTLAPRRMTSATADAKGAVKLSDDDPQPLGTADPSSASDVSRGGHVHAHGNLGGGSLHAVATGGVAGFQSAADKAKEDLYPAISGLTPGDVLTALTSSTVGFAPPSGGGGIPALTPGDILYADATGTLVTLPIGIDGSTLHAEDFGGTFLPTWDILPPRGGAGGDLGGTYPDPIVTGLQGFPISTTDPVMGDTLVFDGTFYTPTALVAADISDFDTQVRASTLNQMTAPTADLSINSHKLTNITDPTADQDAATKAYVDAVAQGLAVKGSARLATTAALPTNTYLAGVLTGTATGVLTVDGSAVALNDRLLVKNEVAQANNGLYVCTTAGAIGVAYVLTRTTDMNAPTEIPGAFAFVEAGTVNAAAGFVVAGAGPYTIGTTAIVWTQFSGAGEISAGTGLSKSGNTLSIDVAYPGQASITTLGTVATGSWQSTKIGLAYGGTNADLSATGGGGQVLKQASTGAAITVGALVAADLPATAVTPAAYGSATQVGTFTVDAAGRLTAAANATIAPAYTSLTYSGLTAGQVLRATGASAAAFGALDLANSNAITGTLPAANGGSGQSSYAVGDLLYASGSAALSKLADVATGNALISGGVTTAPAWGKIGLTTHVSGVLPEANGGGGVAARPAFAAHKNGTNQTGIVANTFTKVTFSTERFDTNGNFASSTFTPTIAGRYLFLLTAYWLSTESGKTYYTLLYKNGVLDQQYFTTAVSSGAVLNGSLICYVDANGSTDTFEMYVVHTAVANMTLVGSTTATTFAGSYL